VANTGTGRLTLFGWVLLFVLALAAMAWKPSRTAILWLMGLIIVSMVLLNSQNLTALMFQSPSGT